MALVSAVKHSGTDLWASCCCGTQLRLRCACPFRPAVKLLFMPEGPLTWKLRILQEGAEDTEAGVKLLFECVQQTPSSATRTGRRAPERRR